MTNISRRAIIAGIGAAIPAATVAAIPEGAERDQMIYAAINAHRAASIEAEEAIAAKEEAFSRFRELEGNPPDRGWGSEWMRFESTAEGGAVCARQKRALDAEESAFRAILSTKPTTPAGLAAIAAYGVELDDGGAVCEGCPEPIRILAAITGIPEPDDDEDQASHDPPQPHPTPARPVLARTAIARMECSR